MLDVDSIGRIVKMSHCEWVVRGALHWDFEQEGRDQKIERLLTRQRQRRITKNAYSPGQEGEPGLYAFLGDFTYQSNRCT